MLIHTVGRIGRFAKVGQYVIMMASKDFDIPVTAEIKEKGRLLKMTMFKDMPEFLPVKVLNYPKPDLDSVFRECKDYGVYNVNPVQATKSVVNNLVQNLGS